MGDIFTFFGISPALLHYIQASLDLALNTALAFLDKAVKPVLVTGPKLRITRAAGPFTELVDASGYVLATMPSAKGLGDGGLILQFYP
ncbi:hypothetical protein E2562_013577 [Oryza meyeriana var. granulata]|uniref:Uncharacterized protein n=1 Tax=Oryza meyeriana var. granulata TaxID=110450 RepID=A0A6G1C5F8_9ORYZ|nr:hypothetical protein E2562_013577 [Oryza meyeriana var. granulata]